MQYERNRRNFNRQAAGSGLNTGTASQAALAQNSTWQRDYGNLRTAEADALARADQQMAALETQYKSAVAQAIAENDYNRAKALMDEYGNQENRDAAMAKTLASYGDFSGYARLYGDDVANNMAQYWISQNPKLAYDMDKRRRLRAADRAALRQRFGTQRRTFRRRKRACESASQRENRRDDRHHRRGQPLRNGKRRAVQRLETDAHARQ